MYYCVLFCSDVYCIFVPNPVFCHITDLEIACIGLSFVNYNDQLETGTLVQCSDGVVRDIVFVVALYLGDQPEVDYCNCSVGVSICVSVCILLYLCVYLCVFFYTCATAFYT